MQNLRSFVGMKGLRRVAALLMAVMMLASSAPLPALAEGEELQPICGLTEHIHGPSCYRPELTCGLEESDPVTKTERVFTQTFQPHKHSDACYDKDGVLRCGYVEDEYYHLHNKYCQDEEGRNVCGLFYSAPHEHTDECYTEKKTLTCPLDESTGHVHTEECYTVTRKLTCKYAKEHVHSDACFRVEEVDGKKVKCAVCGYVQVPRFESTENSWTEKEIVVSEGHRHTDACYTIPAEPNCGIPEHIHTAACYPMPQPVVEPTEEPTAEPTEEPTPEPTEEPTAEPTEEPTPEPTEEPTAEPTEEPTAEPTEEPTPEPTEEPTAEPTEEPTPEPTEEPTAEPTEEPTPEPTEEPTPEPTEEPTAEPTEEPTPEPTEEPTAEPTEEPTPEPTEEPTAEPTEEPTPEPTEEPTAEPTEEPTPEPTEEPTPEPTEEPTAEPTEEPTAEPTEEPTPEPTEEPTAEPTEEPTPEPTEEPTPEPTEEPTPEPTEEPTAEPTEEPTPEPTEEPTEEPTAEPTDKPTPEPTAEPTDKPTVEPTDKPTVEPIVQDSSEPVFLVYRTREESVRLSDVLEALEIDGVIVSVDGVEDGMAAVPGRVELLFADGGQTFITLGREYVYETTLKEETVLLADVLSALEITGEIAAVAGAEETENGWTVAVPGTVSILFTDENAVVLTLRRLVELTESDVEVEKTSQTVEDLIKSGAITAEQALALGLITEPETPPETRKNGEPKTTGLTRGNANAKAPVSGGEDAAVTKTETVVLDIRLANDAVITEDGRYQVPVCLSDPIELVAEGCTVQQYSIQAYHIADGKAVAVPVQDVVVKDGRLVSFVIVTDGFSPYVVKYTVDFVYQPAKAVITLDFSEYVYTGAETAAEVHENDKKLTVIDIEKFIRSAAAQEEKLLLCDVLYTVYLQNTDALTVFDADFFRDAAIVIDGKSVEYAGGQIILTDDVKSSAVVFTTEKATLKAEISNYLKPAAPIVPEDADGFSYRFLTRSITVAEILESLGIVSSYYSIVSVSDENLVAVEKEILTLIPRDYFDKVVLSLSLSDGTEVDIALSNPAPIKPGETVTVQGVGSFSAMEEIPAGTQMVVDSKLKVSDKLIIPVSAKKSEIVSDPVFFDISLIGPDGKEIQTGAEVTISTDIPLPEAPDGHVARVTGVKVFHIGEKGEAEELKGTAYALGEGKISSVSFTTGGFSLFAIVYTVDFVFAGVQYSMPGGGTLLLSELFEALGIEEAVADVISITFSNPEYLTVEPYGDDWRLYSHQSFTTPEKLTIVTVNGVIEIDVTDPVTYNLRDAVSVATINGQTAGPISLRPDEQYRIHLEFVEVPGAVQFPTTSNTMTYQLPVGFQPGQALSGVPIVLRYTEDNLSHTLTDCTYDLDTNGVITLHLSDIAKEKLATSGDGIFMLDIVTSYTGPTGPVDFGGSHIFDITVDNSSSVAVSKSGFYDSAANKVKYTVNVDSTGINNNVVVSDAITGTALSLDGGSFVIKDGSGTVRNDITPTVSGNGFNLTVPQMENNDRLTIEYTASVNWDDIGNGKGTIQQTGNTVTISSDEDPHNDPVTHNLENRINYNPLAKWAGDVVGEDTADTKTIPWTITLNAQQLKNMAGTTITDTIDYGSRSIMHYTGQGVTVTVMDGNSVVGSPQTLTWDSLGVDPATATSWQYTIPDNGQPDHYQYIFTYNTTVDVHEQNGNVQVQNTVSDQNWNNAGGWQEVHPGSGVIGVAKVNNSATETEMTWTVTLDVPASGLNKAVVTDNFPTLNWGGDLFQDTLKADTIEIQGLDSNENYTIRTTDDKYVITFFKDQLKTEPGLNASGTDARRTITITFTTENDHAWVTLHRDLDHTNYVAFEGGNSTVYAQATGNVPQTGVKKTGRVLDTVEYNGENVVIFEYTIDLYGVQGTDFPITVTDTYDSALTFFDLSGGNGSNGLPGMATYWGQQVQNGYRNGTHRDEKLHPVNDTNTHTLTFTIEETDVDKDGDGNFLPRYQIIYYMIASEEALITSSISKADRTEEIGNTAAWGNSDDTVTIDYSYPGLVKNNVPPSSQDMVADAGQRVLYDPATGTTGFEIVINPGKRILNGSSPMTMTDVFSATLSVDYSSIKVWVDDVEDTGTPRQVTYDYRGDKGTFTIPDGKKVVIRYDAKVIGNPTQWVSYNNTASMSGYTDGTAGNCQISGTGEAGFNINSIRVFKYAAGDMTQGIGNVTFTLVDENGDPVLYTNSSTEAGHEHTAGQPVTYTTGANGYVVIRPSEQEDGFSLQKGITYYLKETGTPSAFAKNNTIYRFTLSDNPDYAIYEYHSGDIMKIYNWPALGRIDVRKTFVGTSSNLTESEKRLITFEIRGTYPGTNDPVRMDEWGYPIEASKATGTDAVFVRTFSYADFSIWGGEYFYSMEDLVDGTYTVREINAALPGYQTVTTTSTVYTVSGGTATQTATGNENATVTISGQSSHRVDVTNTYSNKKPGVDIIIKKINNNGGTVTNLYGAKFLLEKWDVTANGGAGAFVTYTEGSVDSDGTFTISYINRDSGVTLSSLDVGRYRITEIQAPTNYKIAENGDGSFEFEVTESGGSLSVSYTADTDVYSFASGSNTFSVNNDVKHSYNITKVDGANVSVKLGGAEFSVYQHVDRNSQEQDRAAAKGGTLEKLHTYVSDLDGKFEIQFNDVLNSGQQYSDAQDVIYFIMETKAPRGYSLPNNPTLYYFFFGSTNPGDITITHALNLAEYNWNRTISNDLIELQVTKNWLTLDNENLNPSDVDEIEFKLYQIETVTNRKTGVSTTSEPQLYPDDHTIYTIAKTTSGSWPTLTIGYLPVVGVRNENEIHTYAYKVEEIVPDGYQVSYSESEDGRYLYMTNKPEGTSVEALKVWSSNTPETWKKTALYLYRMPKDGSSAWERYKGPYKLPNAKPEGSTLTDEEWLATENAWLAVWDDLPKEYLYHVVEALTENGLTNDQAARFAIVESSNNVAGISEGRVAITNVYQETSVKVQKVWSADTPEAVKTAANVKVCLMCRPKGDSSAAWVNYNRFDWLQNLPQTVAGQQVWEYEWTDLSTDYEYSVHEYMDSAVYTPRFTITVTGPDGNETTNPASATVGGTGYDGGTFIATNTYRSTSIQVQKKWLGNPSQSKIIESQVTFQLQYKDKASANDPSVAWNNYGNPVYVSAYVNGQWVLNTGAYQELANGDWLFTWDDLPDTNVYKVVENFTYNGNMFSTTYTSESGNVISEVSGVEGGKIIVTNTYNATSIEVEKKWVNETPSVTTTAQITLKSRRTGTNDPFEPVSGAEIADLPLRRSYQDQGGNWVTVYQDVDNPWFYRWEDLPIGYDYQVYETPKDGYVTVYSANNDGITSGKITVTNIKTNHDNSKLTIEKEWLDYQGNALAASEIPDNFSISAEVWQKKYSKFGGCRINITVYKNNNTVSDQRTYFVQNPGGSVALTIGGDYEKTVTVDGNPHSVASGGNVFTVNGGASPVNVEIRFTDQANSGDEYQAPGIWGQTITNEQPYMLESEAQFGNTLTFSTLQEITIPSEDPGIKYEYYIKNVTETVSGAPITGYTCEFINNGGIQKGTIAIVNTQEQPTETSVTVAKEWENADGTNTWPTGMTVEATLYKTVNGTTSPVAAADLTTWGSSVTTNPVTLSSGTASATWDKLPLKETVSGTEYDVTYSVAETAVLNNGAAGTSTTENGLTTYTVNGTKYDSFSSTTDTTTTITNVERLRIIVEKKWALANGGSAWPTGVQVDVAIYTQVGESAPVEMVSTGLTESRTSWDKPDLPVYDQNGQRITYSVREKSVEYGGAVITPVQTNGVTSYTVDGKTYDIFTVKTSTGFALINAERVSLPVTKVWTGDVPEGATVTVGVDKRERKVIDNGTEVASLAAFAGSFTATADTFTITGTGNSWSGVKENLPRFRQDGNDLYEIQYSAQEISVMVGGTDLTSNYTSTATQNADGSVTITNTPYEPEKVGIMVTKEWYLLPAGGGTPVSLPSSAAKTFQLYRTTASIGEGPWTQSQITGISATPYGSPFILRAGQTYTRNDLPKDNGHQDYNYFVVETGADASTEYVKSGSTWTVKNYQEENGLLEVDKIWLDGEGNDVTDSQSIVDSITYDIYQTKTTTTAAKASTVSVSGSVSYGISSWGQATQYATITSPVGGIIVGSKISVTVTSTSNAWLDLGNLRINNAPFVPTVYSGNNASNPLKGGNNGGSYSATQVFDSAPSTLTFSGALENTESGQTIEISIVVLEAPSGSGSSTPTGTVISSPVKVGTVTLTKTTATLALEPDFQSSGITVAPGAGDWSSVLSNLPKHDVTETSTTIVTEDSVYSVSEGTVAHTTGTPVYSPSGINGSADVTPNGSVITITNTFSLGSIKLKKIVTVEGSPAGNDVTGTYTFVIAGDANDANTSGVSKTVIISLNHGAYTATLDGAPVSADGERWFAVTGLPHGAYTVTEVGTNWAGYNCATSFSVNGLLTVGSTAAVTLNGSTPTATVQATNAYTPGVELPATGGPGTAAYTVSGLALILGALWMLLRRRREQN